jgi:hypothetical protein
MPEKDPLNWTLGTWVLAVIMASGGGVINWFAHAKKRHPHRFSIIELIGEMATSGLVGIGVFMVAASYDQPTAICAAFAGVSGHMATRVLFLVERWIEKQAAIRIRYDDPDDSRDMIRVERNLDDDDGGN